MGHPDGLAVVGFFLEAVDAPNPKFDTLVEGIEGIKKRDQTVQVTSGRCTTILFNSASRLNNALFNMSLF